MKRTIGYVVLCYDQVILTEAEMPAMANQPAGQIAANCRTAASVSVQKT